MPAQCHLLSQLQKQQHLQQLDPSPIPADSNTTIQSLYPSAHNNSNPSVLCSSAQSNSRTIFNLSTRETLVYILSQSLQLQEPINLHSFTSKPTPASIHSSELITSSFYNLFSIHYCSISFPTTIFSISINRNISIFILTARESQLH